MIRAMTLPFTTVRDPFLSVFQSAAAAFARLQPTAAGSTADHPMVQGAAQVVAASQDPARAYSPAPGLPHPSATCVELGLQLFGAMVSGNTIDRQQAEDRFRFSQCDPLWAKVLVDYAGTLTADGVPRSIPYIRYSALGDFVLSAPKAQLRVALLSDWGTGTQIARDVLTLLALQRPDIVIHLGDIYYSGTKEECREHFLAPLTAALPETPLFTLCGNHDVYSGGSGYYGLLDTIGQPASYFCLRSPDHAWQILAADTGLNDRDPLDEAGALTRLDPQEELWHADKLRGFSGQTILLSHHQPFSAYARIGPAAPPNPVNPNLMASHERLSQAGRIDAWFWGHEHRLRAYAPYRGVAVGRNIGYGAVPTEASAYPHTPLANLPDPPPLAADIKLDVEDGADTHGFALLDLGGAAIEASYWALTRPDGPISRETIGAVAV